LLDEPLSNLDAALREEMRVELVRLLKAQGITAIYVTHDRVEALAMADRIVVMREGSIAQIGSPEDLYDRPANPFIAGFLGAANFMVGDVVREPGKGVSVHSGKLVLHGLANGPIGDRGMMMVRPEDGSLYNEDPGGDGNGLEGTVIHSEFLGGRWRHVVSISAELTLQLLTPEKPQQSQVWVRFPIDRCLVLNEDRPVAETVRLPRLTVQ
jgi:ABC-type Fe3+/spermidine/putrescine transport system ATPase subunit